MNRPAEQAPAAPCPARPSRARRFGLAVVLVAVPALAGGRAPAAEPDSGARTADLRSLLAPALAAVPDIATRGRETAWRAGASPALRGRLDRVEQTLAQALAAASGPDAGPIAQRDRDALRQALAPSSQPIEADRLLGAWRCRKLLIDALGLFVYPFFDCRVARDATCLRLEKPKGSQRLAGCLTAVGARHMAFLGQWRTDYEAGEEGGFLSQTAPDRLRLILPKDDASVEVIDIKR